MNWFKNCFFFAMFLVIAFIGGMLLFSALRSTKKENVDDLWPQVWLRHENGIWEKL